MVKLYSNSCSRCGKERIVLKIWKEGMGNATVITKEMICPDPECQKEVDHENKKQQQKREFMKQKSAQRLLERRAAIDAARVVEK